MDKYYANRGVERNKKPLKNIVYEVELSQLKNVAEDDRTRFEKYKFKELGYLYLLLQYEDEYNKHPNCMTAHGFITPADLKERLGEKQYAKFCQGKRIFIVQRRVDGKNVPKKQKDERN